VSELAAIPFTSPTARAQTGKTSFFHRSSELDRVYHFEVPYLDKERAEQFYSLVFAWQFSPAPGDMPYTFVLTTPVNDLFQPADPGGINGGMYPR